MIGLGDIGQLLSGVANVTQAIVNPVMQAKTNESNERMVFAQNAAAREESEKAYERSKPTTQVTNMRQVGMSQAGAINALNGGGSYTPAPVNVSQDQAPQLDVSGLTNVLMTVAQLKQQEKLANEQLEEQRRHSISELEEQKRQFDENLDFEKQKWNDEANTRGQIFDNLVATGEKLRAEAKKIGIETNIAETNKEILNLTKEDRVNAENAENLARKVRAENQKYIEDIRNKGLKNISEDVFMQLVSSITEREAVASTLEMFSMYVREKGSSVSGKLLKEFAKLSAKSGSPLTSINP